MKKVRPPEFLENLYRDMRDRRLLLPAAALIVALIAVPVLLGSQSSSTAPPPQPGGVNASASAATPAVVARQLGITNYRERLEELQSKNPFHQQYTEPSAAAALNATATGSSGSGSSTTGDTGGTSVTGSTSSVTDSSVGASSSSVSSSPSVGSPSSPPARPRGPKPGFHLYTYRVSVKVGEPGELRDRPEVKRLALLPNKKKPIVSFIGVSEGAEQALFLVSHNVDSVGGDGRCVPGRNSCQYVVMGIGDKANLQYRPDNKRYNLILTGIHAVEIDDKPPAKVAGKAEPMAKLPELGPG
jgi:hypothetical protein